MRTWSSLTPAITSVLSQTISHIPIKCLWLEREDVDADGHTIVQLKEIKRLWRKLKGYIKAVVIFLFQ